MTKLKVLLTLLITTTCITAFIFYSQQSDDLPKNSESRQREISSLLRKKRQQGIIAEKKRLLKKNEKKPLDMKTINSIEKIIAEKNIKFKDEEIPTISSTAGILYSDCKIKKWTPTHISVSYRKKTNRKINTSNNSFGETTILFSELEDFLKHHLEYSEKLETSYNKNIEYWHPNSTEY